MTVRWEYERSTVPAVTQCVERELIQRVERGWLVHDTEESTRSDARAPTVTFLFRRFRVAARPSR